MSKLYKGSVMRGRVARSLRESPHRAGQARLRHDEEKFNVGDRVRLKRNGLKTVIVEDHSYGYVVEGVSGYLPGRALEKI